MSHTAGPNKAKVDQLAKGIAAFIGRSGCTISEAQEAIHEATMILLKTALAPLEDFTCPTCPNPRNMTPALLKKIGRAIRKTVEKEKHR